MIYIVLFLVSCIIIYLYYNHLDNSTKDLERDFTIANEHYLQREYSKAISILSQNIEKYPTHYQLWNNRGEAKFQQGRFEEALRDFHKSVEVLPDTNINIRAYGNIMKTITAIKMSGNQI